MKEQKLEIYLFFILLGIALYLTFLVFSPYIQTLIVAMVLAVVFHPIYKAILSKIPKYEYFAALLTMAVLIIVVLIPLVFFGIQLSDEVKNIYDMVFRDVGEGGMISKLTDTANKLVSNFSPFGVHFPVFQVADTQSYALNFLSWLRGHFGDIFSGLLKVMINFFLFLISFYYFLRDGKKFREVIINLSPFADDRDEMILHKLKNAALSTVKGSILVAIVQGIALSIGFTIFGVPSAVLWGSVASVTALIPGVGTSLVMIPGILYLFSIGAHFNAVGLLIWGFCGVGLIDNFLAPKFIERGIHIHSLLILLSAIGGIGFFGPIGFLLGPLTLSFLFVLLDIYKTIIIKDKAVS